MDALAKSDFLTPKEQQQLRRFQSCEAEISTINDVRRVRGKGELSKEERRAIEAEYNYDPANAQALARQWLEARKEHIKSTRLMQKQLDKYLRRHWSEILALKMGNYPLEEAIEKYCLKKMMLLPNESILGAKKGEIIHELECIRETLEYRLKQRAEAPQTEQTTTPAKDAKEKATINVRISGGIQAENVQIGNHASIQKQRKAEEQNKSPLIRLLQLFGWLWTQVKWLWANVWPKA